MLSLPFGVRAVLLRGWMLERAGENEQCCLVGGFLPPQAGEAGKRRRLWALDMDLHHHGASTKLCNTKEQHIAREWTKTFIPSRWELNWFC